jgi:hypothetical protein
LEPDKPYTAVIHGKNNQSGIVVLETYDMFTDARHPNLQPLEFSSSINESRLLAWSLPNSALKVHFGETPKPAREARALPEMRQR